MGWFATRRELRAEIAVLRAELAACQFELAVQKTIDRHGVVAFFGPR